MTIIAIAVQVSSVVERNCDILGMSWRILDMVILATAEHMDGQDYHWYAKGIQHLSELSVLKERGSDLCVWGSYIACLNNLCKRGNTIRVWAMMWVLCRNCLTHEFMMQQHHWLVVAHSGYVELTSLVWIVSSERESGVLCSGLLHRNWVVPNTVIFTDKILAFTFLYTVIMIVGHGGIHNTLCIYKTVKRNDYQYAGMV